MIALALLIACGDDRLALEIPLHADGSPGAVAALGAAEWRIEAAEVTVARVQLAAPEGFARHSWPALVPTAHAHPGHDLDGGVAGEWTGAVPVDGLAGAQPLGGLAAYEGEITTARVRLGSVRVSGRVVEGERERPFAFALDEVGEVTGLSVVATLSAAAPPTELRLSVNPALWLAFADPLTLPGEGTLTLADGALENTFRFGLLSTTSWSLTLTQSEEQTP